MAANYLALVFQTIVQLASVPVLSQAFGVVGFGYWSILSAIPNYLILSDLGFVNAAMNDMTIKNAQGNRIGFLSVYQSFSLLIIALFTFISLAFAMIVFVTLRLDVIWPESMRSLAPVLPILVLYSSLCMVSHVPVSVFRATGSFAKGTILYESAIFVEGLMMLVTALTTRNMMLTAIAPVVGRLVFLPLLYAYLLKCRPFARLGFEHFDFGELKRLLPSSFGIVIVPASLAISLQGTVLAIGTILGPVAVATFVPIRTASRFAIQIAVMVARAVVPELSAARGRSDHRAELMNWRITMVVMVVILVLSALLFEIFGTALVTLWTGGMIRPDRTLVTVMACSIVFHGLWFTVTMLLTASHDHMNMAKWVFGVSLVGLAATLLLIINIGVVGGALGVVAVDIILAAIALIYVKRRQRVLRDMISVSCESQDF